MDTAPGTGLHRGKQWVALGLLTALALLVGGWTLLVSPKRAEAALLREQAVMQAAANERSETHLEVLRSMEDQVPEREAYLDEVATRIPDVPAVPDLLRSLSGAAASAGVELVSVVPGSAIAVAAPSTAAAPGVAPVPAPAATDPAVPGAAVPGAAVAPESGLLAVPLTLEVVGGFYEIEQFLADLEELPRALRLTDVALQVGEAAVGGGTSPVAGRSLRTTLTGSVFVRTSPSPAPDVAAAPATAPATAPVAAPLAETTS